MPTYIWTAKDVSGKPVVREIQHDTVEGAKEVLLAEGCTDLKLILDDIMATAMAGYTENPKLIGEHKATTEELVKCIRNPSNTLFRIIWDGVDQSKGLVFCGLALGLFELYRGYFTAALTIFAGLVVWVAFLIWLGLPSIYYAKLLNAADWNRWNEVLGLVETLRKLGKTHFIKIPFPELMRYRARALASQGHLPQALEEYSQCENQPGCPSWLYKAFVAGLYDTAKQHDKGLEWTWMAVRENPISSLQLDLANRLLRYKRDAVKAREVIAIAEKSTMNEVARPFYLRCLGMLAYLEGDNATARKELEASLAIMLNTAQQPYREGNISVARGYLCCVLARQGDMPAARKCFDQAKSYLVATGEDELLAECQNALGVV